MRGFGKAGTVCAPAMASSDRSLAADIYHHYAVGLYGQALLALGDPALAEHVVCDIIIDECALFPPRGRGEADARHRLAESAFRRCQQLAAGHDRSPGRPPSACVADCIDPGGLLNGTERGAPGARAVRRPWVRSADLISRRRRERQASKEGESCGHWATPRQSPSRSAQPRSGCWRSSHCRTCGGT